MIQTLLAYLIVALAAAWVLWSIILPARTREILRRRVGLGTPACGALGGVCGEGGCGDCPLASTQRAPTKRAPLGTRP
jgi:hypothetical protein